MQARNVFWFHNSYFSALIPFFFLYLSSSVFFVRVNFLYFFVLSNRSCHRATASFQQCTRTCDCGLQCEGSSTSDLSWRRRSLCVIVIQTVFFWAPLASVLMFPNSKFCLTFTIDSGGTTISSKKFYCFFRFLLFSVWPQGLEPLKHEYLRPYDVKDDRFQPPHLSGPAESYPSCICIYFYE